MPELPEVETICRELRDTIVGSEILRCEIFRAGYLRGESPDEFRKDVSGDIVLSVNRRGKYILWDLGAGTILSHLGMTGKFMLLEDGKEAPKHAVARFDFDDITLLMEDVRRFGRLNFYPRGSPAPEIKSLGPEPLSDDFTAGYLSRIFAGRERAVKDLLIDQRIIAGLGNIYASEILFHARIHPLTSGGSLSLYKLRKIVIITGEILELAIENAGTTISDYKRVDDKSGGFQHFLRVYGKNGDECHRCKSEIQRIIIGGRSSFFCPKCQKI